MWKRSRIRCERSSIHARLSFSCLESCCQCILNRRLIKFRIEIELHWRAFAGPFRPPGLQRTARPRSCKSSMTTTSFQRNSVCLLKNYEVEPSGKFHLQVLFWIDSCGRSKFNYEVEPSGKFHFQVLFWIDSCGRSKFTPDRDSIP